MITKFKIFENNIEPQIGDWIVGYRPANQYDNVNLVNQKQYVIDIGKITDIKTKPFLYYDVHFLNGRYVRKSEHILYIAKDKEDAEKYAEIIEKSLKYNL